MKNRLTGNYLDGERWVPHKLKAMQFDSIVTAIAYIKKFNVKQAVMVEAPRETYNGCGLSDIP